jgi:segregation and condensation protein A
MDLLLHLVKEKEVDIHEISISSILGDYLKYLKLLRALDLNNVGEFLVLACELMEIKSRELLPREDFDLEKELDPRNDLIKRLIEFKRYRDMARKLARFAEQRDRHLGRGGPGADLPRDEGEAVDLDLGDADVWILLKAYAKLMEETGFQREYTVENRDLPAQVYIQRLIDRLKGGRSGADDASVDTTGDAATAGVTFTSLFPPGGGRAGLVGTFLGLLELVKRGYARVAQELVYGEILVDYVGPADLRAEDLFKDEIVVDQEAGAAPPPAAAELPST